MLDLLTLFIFPFLMAYAGASDLFTMTISNRISLALVASFIAFALIIGFPLENIGWHLTCGLAMLVITFILFSLGWIGWVNILDYNLLASMIGGLITIAFIYIRKSPLPEWAGSRDWIARLYNADNGVPYGLALAASGLIVFPQTDIWRAAIRF